MNSSEKISLLFVCLGNICRSPTAEAVFIKRVKEAGLTERFVVDSAGVIAAHAGEKADARMRQHAAKRGYDLQSISRPVTPEDFYRFDYLVAMDADNVRDLQAMAPDRKAAGKIFRLLELVPEVETKDVPDPYYGGAEGFEEVLDLVERASGILLKKVLDEHGDAQRD